MIKFYTLTTTLSMEVTSKYVDRLNNRYFLVLHGPCGELQEAVANRFYQSAMPGDTVSVQSWQHRFLAKRKTIVQSV